jgi:hypothetical protein
VQKPSQVVVKRSQWDRGAYNKDSDYCSTAQLRHSDGRMCIWGFYMEACGFTPEQLEGLSSPSDVVVDMDDREDVATALDGVLEVALTYDEDEGDELFRATDTQFCADTMSVNDDGKLQDADREMKLHDEFMEKLSVSLIFED